MFLSRLTLNASLLAALVIFACGQGFTAFAAEPKQPNIILVLVDDMGWGDFSCFGNQEMQTPNIDRLAQEGLRFEQFYVNSPICSPSRCALTTGQYPQRWRINSYLADRKLNNDRGCAQWLDLQAPTLAKFLQQAGYATGHFGKWHLGGQRDVGDAPLITEYGYDRALTNFEGLGPRVLPLCYNKPGAEPKRHALGSDTLGHGPITWEDRSLVTRSFTRAALEFIQHTAKEKQPFYVNLWPDDVHSPFFPPFDRRVPGKIRQTYLGVLQTMDEQLAELFDYVRGNESLRDNTLILICSDNGPEPSAGSAGPFRGNKTMLYEGGIRSPLIAWGPGLVAKNRVGKVNTSSHFAAIDLVPTLLQVAQVTSPVDVKFDGEPLADTLLGTKESSRSEPLFFRRPPDRGSFYEIENLPDLAVREGNWKLLCEYDGSGAELYDLATDREESKDVAADHADVVTKLSTQVVAWHQAMPPDNGATFKHPSPAAKSDKVK